MLMVKDSRSESDSGTVSRAGSFLCEQLQWPPWLQQHVSAKGLENATHVKRLEVWDSSRREDAHQCALQQLVANGHICLSSHHSHT
jgi:hypothetical protein